MWGWSDQDCAEDLMSLGPLGSISLNFSFLILKRWAWEMVGGVSGNLWIVVKDVKTLVVYDVE